MRVIDKGHFYALRMLDTQFDDKCEYLTFVKREGPGYPGNVGHYPGTTTQEVLRALIDRGRYVNKQIPCPETEAAIHLMETALVLLEMRAARRHGRTLKADYMDGIVYGEVCKECGHVGCIGACREEWE